MTPDPQPLPRWRADVPLILRAALLLAGARLVLPALPFHAVRRLLARVAGRPHPERSAPSVGRIIRAVRLANRFSPGYSCLPQALAAEALLAQCGWTPQLRLGLVRRPDGRVEGHAWVELDGQVVIGDQDELAEYSDLALSHR